MAPSRRSYLPWIGALLLLPTVSACSTYAVPRYAASADNVVALRRLRGHPISVGRFTQKGGDSSSQILCRGAGPVTTPNGEPFADYVRNALVSELQMAEVPVDAAPVTLTGTIDDVDFSSTAASWDIAVTISSTNGRRLHVEETFPFDGGFLAEHACNQTAQSFMPAVQDLIAKIVRHPGFVALVSAPSDEDEEPTLQALPRAGR